MKAVLISIQPKWCELIASGKKTIEVRKNKPGIVTPFKCYIYQTKKVWTYDIYSRIANSQQKVIGEFICDCILAHCESVNLSLASNLSCVSKEEIIKYSKGKEVFGWNISDLVIYDEPKELSEFRTFCKSFYDCDKPDCKFFINGDSYEYDESDCACNGLKPIESPPQSWCFVEELVGDNNA